MFRKSRTVLLLTLCAGAVLLGSCQPALRLWIIPGSTRDNLVFGFAETRRREERVRPQSIQVFRCESLNKGGREIPNEGEAIWQAAAPKGVSTEPANRITYGRDEHGLQTRRGPTPLSAGCYAVLAYGYNQRGVIGAGATRFKVREDGSIVED